MDREELEKKASEHYYKDGGDSDSPIPFMVGFAEEMLAAKDAETAELKKDITHFEKKATALDALATRYLKHWEESKADNARLREGLEDLKDHSDRMAKAVVRGDISRARMHNEMLLCSIDRARNLLKSPADRGGKEPGSGEKHEVSFSMDGFRMQLVRAYMELCHELEEMTDSDGYIRGQSYQIGDEMDQLESLVCSMCHVSIPAVEHFEFLSDWLEKQNVRGYQEGKSHE